MSDEAAGACSVKKMPSFRNNAYEKSQFHLSAQPLEQGYQINNRKPA